MLICWCEKTMGIGVKNDGQRCEKRRATKFIRMGNEIHPNGQTGGDMRIRPERAKALSPGQRPGEQGHVSSIALKEQKKHTLCVPAAPVGRTREAGWAFSPHPPTL